MKALGGIAKAKQGATGAEKFRASSPRDAMRGRGVPVASGTQRGKHARAQAQAHERQEEGERDKARGTALAASSSL